MSHPLSSHHIYGAVRWASLSSLLILAACAPLVEVKVHECAYQPTNGAAEATAARKLRKAAPQQALGDYLDAARGASQALQAHPQDETARKDYNHNVARAVEMMVATGLPLPCENIRIPSDQGGYVVSIKGPRKERVLMSDYRWYADDTLEIGGQDFKQRSRVAGLGAPFAVIDKRENKNFRQDFGWKHDFGALTAVIRFKGPDQRQAQVELIRPLLVESTKLNDTTYKLSADFTAPLALLVNDARPDQLGMSRLLHPQEYADTARLVRLQDYDPHRVPVLFVHGLDSSPEVWAQMINRLREDPLIREHCQLWVYSYPSGYPYPYSAALLRKELDRVDKVYPDHQPIVLVGHSMGAMIARLMITDAGDKLWISYFGHPPDQTSINRTSKKMVEDCLVFDRRHDVGRVIFISGPHRGSEIASGWIGWLGSHLIHPPRMLGALNERLIALVTLDPAAMHLNHMPNSIDTLAPNNRFVLEVNKIPISTATPYHSIIGDRGRGDTPNSSDGVVAYWSSHLDGAQSERIVPSDHGAPRNTQAIDEVIRILHLQ